MISLFTSPVSTVSLFGLFPFLCPEYFQVLRTDYFNFNVDVRTAIRIRTLISTYDFLGLLRSVLSSIGFAIFFQIFLSKYFSFNSQFFRFSFSYPPTIPLCQILLLEFLEKVKVLSLLGFVVINGLMDTGDLLFGFIEISQSTGRENEGFFS